jgi:hypothetical protein
LKYETASLRGIWMGELTEKEIDETIKEIRSKWRIDALYIAQKTQIWDF